MVVCMIRNNKNNFVFDLVSVERAVKLFCTKNQFAEQLSKELLFVSKGFTSFFNYCQNAKEIYNINQLIELFQQNLSMQAMSMGTGLQTDAVEFLWFVPMIRKVIDEIKQEDLLSDLKSREEKLNQREERINQKEESLKKASKKVAELEKEAKEKIEKYNGKRKQVYNGYGGCGGNISYGHC